MYDLSTLFFNHGFKFQSSNCNGCHNLTMLNVNISDIPVITVKKVGYCCVIHDINKSETISVLKNPALDDRGRI